MISHSIRAVTLATLFAVTMFAAGTSALAASFDGPWSVTVVTRSGPCDQAYRYGVTISRGVVSYAGGGPVSLTGRVSPSGNVTVRVSSGPQYAVGSGRLSRSTGGGSWRGQGPNGSCAGGWSASRGGARTAENSTHSRARRESKLGPRFRVDQRILVR